MGAEKSSFMEVLAIRWLYMGLMDGTSKRDGKKLYTYSAYTPFLFVAMVIGLARTVSEVLMFDGCHKRAIYNVSVHIR